MVVLGLGTVKVTLLLKNRLSAPMLMTWLVRLISGLLSPLGETGVLRRTYVQQ